MTEYRTLTRRGLLRAVVSAAAAFLAACTASKPKPTPAASPTSTPTLGPKGSGLPACVVRPAQTEGPFFVDERLNRSDIRNDPADGSVRPGAELRITINVSRVRGSACTPLSGAQVDLWHCDADGVYSDVQDASGKKFLRGYQMTDANGRAEFTTIYPGWYGGRAVHIHFKIRVGAEEFTSQLYFDDALTDTVHARPPYSARGRRNTRNADDRVYNTPPGSGDQLVLAVQPSGARYAGSFDIGLRVS